MSLVGIIANPASGRDIRRLVARASVFPNQEKVNIVSRVLAGLKAAGVDQVAFMPDAYRIVQQAAEFYEAHGSATDGPELIRLDQPITDTALDTERAARSLSEMGAGCLITLGGDGSNRAAAKNIGSVPMLPLSTGTNNVFPMQVEGTVAGLAAGFLATGQAPLEACADRTTRLEVLRDGELIDIALVDIAVYDDLFVASRAVWDITKVTTVFLNRCHPDRIGLSALGGVFRTINPEEPVGLHLTVGPGGRVLLVPLAPGLVVDAAIREIVELTPGQARPVDLAPALLALDGEREVEIDPGDQVSIRLSLDGPILVDPGRTMAAAVERGLFERSAI